ncbi:hypothetical protein F511_41160 [Dorcoceras hygrometricum]|uniref:Uncharacterized protein n=1 Tax=Dorcoceras hygrometricum TaxID=472368 RepID=A0A2Z7CM10_9LAMI|nr:hypothetical protein F511_41160 [Dorcoceras hygrometricum]
MTSAISAVVKKRKSWISDDDVSSDVITINKKPAGSYSSLFIQSQALQDQRLDNQSQATVYPVAGYSALHIQSTGKPDAKKLKEISNRSS